MKVQETTEIREPRGHRAGRSVLLARADEVIE
jgi:hypothetical protein